jgi:hypothetical protein
VPFKAIGLIRAAPLFSSRWLVLGRSDATARRDLWAGLAVAASSFAVWGLYTAYFLDE